MSWPTPTNQDQQRVQVSKSSFGTSRCPIDWQFQRYDHGYYPLFPASMLVFKNLQGVIDGIYSDIINSDIFQWCNLFTTEVEKQLGQVTWPSINIINHSSGYGGYGLWYRTSVDELWFQGFTGSVHQAFLHGTERQRQLRELGGEVMWIETSQVRQINRSPVKAPGTQSPPQRGTPLMVVAW